MYAQMLSATPRCLTLPTMLVEKELNVRVSQEKPLTVAAKEFWGDDNWRSLPERLDRLCRVLLREDYEQQEEEELSCCFSDDPIEARRIVLTAIVLLHSPPSYHVDFESLFRSSLVAHLQQQPESLAPSQEDLAWFPSLQKLGWLRRGSGLLERPLCRAVRKQILAVVQDAIQGDFETPDLFTTQIEPICQGRIAPWLSALTASSSTDSDDSSWKHDLHLMAAHCFCQVRLDELFELIADYPDSHAAVLELTRLLKVTQLHAQLGTSLRAALVRRLNHPGAQTSQIIEVYISTIQVLRVMDPTDRLLQQVAEPVRAYLRGRADTVRCIITSLTDAAAVGSSSGDLLYQELRRQDAKPLEHVAAQEDDDGDDDEPPTMDWQPAPSIFHQRGTFLEASRTSSSGGGADSDILAMVRVCWRSCVLHLMEMYWLCYSSCVSH